MENEIISTGVKKLQKTGYKNKSLIMIIPKEIRAIIDNTFTIKVMRYDVNEKKLIVEFN